MWVRYFFKDGKVFAEVDAKGRLVAADGKVRIKYREEDDRTYTAAASRLAPFDEEKWKAIKAARAEAKAATKARSMLHDMGAAEDDLSSRPPTEGGLLGAGGKRGRSASPIPAGALVEDLVTYALAGKCIAIFTDGASSGNPGPAGAGVVMICGARRKEISRPLGETTNNVAELEAVRVGLEAVKNRRLPVRLFTDSTYAEGVLTRNWKPKANRELIASIRKLLRGFPDLRLAVVKGHADIEENERADALARTGAKRNAGSRSVSASRPDGSRQARGADRESENEAGESEGEREEE